jgi:hypothetical protein
MLRNVGMRSVEIRKQLVMLEKFIESDQYNWEDHCCTWEWHVVTIVIVVSIKVQVRIWNKMLETLKASTIRASNKSKSVTSNNETCLQTKVERYCSRIYKRVTCFLDSITVFLPGIKKHVGVSWCS